MNNRFSINRACSKHVMVLFTRYARDPDLFYFDCHVFRVDVDDFVDPLAIISSGNVDNEENDEFWYNLRRRVAIELDY
jgi:hypothetical protein